ncbi:hypothetical protein ACFLXB_09155, partial [Chloroflexota bacterium]
TFIIPLNFSEYSEAIKVNLSSLKIEGEFQVQDIFSNKDIFHDDEYIYVELSPYSGTWIFITPN